MALEPKLERLRIGDVVGLKQIHLCLDQSFVERVIRNVPIQSIQDSAVVNTNDLDVVDGWLVLNGFLETIPFLMHVEARDRSLAHWHHRLQDDLGIARHSVNPAKFELLSRQGHIDNDGYSVNFPWEL